MNVEPAVALTTQEATEILAVLAGLSGTLLSGSIKDEALADGVLRRLGIEQGPGAARKLHARLEGLIQAIRRDLDRLV